MVATWRAIWILIALCGVLVLVPAFFGVINGLTLLGVVCGILAVVFVNQRGWE